MYAKGWPASCVQNGPGRFARVTLLLAVLSMDSDDGSAKQWPRAHLLAKSKVTTPDPRVSWSC